MKICYVSMAPIDHPDPFVWLDSISYFTRILEELALTEQISSLHYGITETQFERNGVKYLFSTYSIKEQLIGSQDFFLKQYQPDVIVLHGFHSVLPVFRFLLRQQGGKVLVQHHGEKVFAFPKSWIQRLNDRRIDGYLFSSRDLSSEWIEKGLIRNPSKIFEVMEATSGLPNAINDAPRDRSFLWVGRLNDNKDPLTLIDGFLRFAKSKANVSLTMIFGTNELLPDVQKRIVGHENIIKLKGIVPHNQMSSWYQRSAYIISTSLNEGSGIAVIEAISYGCIPVLTDIPSFRTMTNGGEIGMLFSTKNPSALSEALSKAITLDVNRERAIVQSFYNRNLSARAIADRLREIFTFLREKGSTSV